ncbi:MAG TPA: 5-oxoprolinase subunit PxpB [Chloroflexia bacterium]|nr:5-oxoprolinase subunit PxpB [Chloroflexia bacterium]
MTPDFQLSTFNSGLLRPLGDSAVLVVFGEAIDVALNARVHALAAVLRGRRAGGDPAWGVPVPAYSSLLVPYDPGLLTYDEAAAHLTALLESDPAPAAGEPTAAVVEIPVGYGGVGGPDLAEVAARQGLTPAEVIALHSGTLYRVFMLGFAPGFAYLGPLPPALVIPRRATPRPRVPPGSVAIAGHQTGIYPLATPGGWHLLGQTPAVLWDAHRTPPALLAPGQLVRFVAQ